MIKIGYIRTNFTSKFGIPRQSGLVSTKGEIHLVPPFNSIDAVKGLMEFSHIWIIWEFSKSGSSKSLTVRPPRLGGNVRKGVFATRSPYRPNPIGLSCLKLESIDFVDGAPVLKVSGADLLDKTPIYDIKPYIPYSDCHPDATGGFASENKDHRLEVSINFTKTNSGDCLWDDIPKNIRDEVTELLSLDPRPAYQSDPSRVYGMEYSGFDFRFTVNDDKLTIVEIKKN